MCPLQKSKRSNVNLFIALCWFIYFASYLARQDYNAALAPMLEELNLAKSALSFAGTGSFVTYGVGQLLCGLLLRRVPARGMMFGGLLLSAGCNLLLLGSTVFLQGHGPALPLAMTVIWSLNGFGQAMLWPSLVQIMAETLSPKDYRRACVHVTVASSFGTTAVYLLVPLCVRLGSARWVFCICAALAVAAAVLCGTAMPKQKAMPFPLPERGQPEALQKQGVSMFKMFTSFGLIPVLIAVALHGMLRDGVTTWMPVLITEAYPGFSSARSVLTAAVLPLVAALSIQLAGLVGRKIRHELRSAALFFAVGAAAALALVLLYGRSLAGSVAMMALLTSCMHGVNLMLICQLPARFARCNCTGAAAGLINAFTYLGSAVSMFGIALLAERAGWKITTMAWFGIVLAGTAICLLFTRKVRRILQMDEKLVSQQNCAG
jgi:OPA family glycerol-3-phosphate transporter-like MFS transporter